MAVKLPIVKLFFDAATGEYDDETGVEKLYYADLRLKEYRSVDNPHDVVKEYEVSVPMEDIIANYSAEPKNRCYFEEGAEIGSQIIEDTGWYINIFGVWRWDEESQEGEK